MAANKLDSNSHIDIFLRVRPVKQASACLALDAAENKVEFNIPRTASQGYAKACTSLHFKPAALSYPTAIGT